MARIARLLSTRISKAVTFPTSVRTLGELKSEIEKFDDNNNLHIEMQATLKSTGNIINDSDSLPESDFTIYFSPSKQKSGLTEDEENELIKEFITMFITKNL